MAPLNGCLHAGDAASLESAILEATRQLARPYVVALDGRSGSGKTTLAGALARRLDATVLDGDGFFSGGVDVRRDTPQDRARDCIDWRRQRPVLEALRAGRAASYFAFDWEAFDGRMEVQPTHVESRGIVLFEGVYSARPELRDLIDLRVLVRADDQQRAARLRAREGGIGPWERQWLEAEAWYLTEVMPESRFDVVVTG